MTTLSALARASKPVVTSAPRPRPRPTPRRRNEAYLLRRDSELNARGTEIVFAAHELLEMIDELIDGDAGGKLSRELAKLGVPEHDADGESCLGVLANLLTDCQGLRWALKAFADQSHCITLPTVEQEVELLAEVAARTTRRSR